MFFKQAGKLCTMFFIVLIAPGCGNLSIKLALENNTDHAGHDAHAGHEAHVGHGAHDAAALPAGYAAVHVDPTRLQWMGVLTEKVAVRQLTQTLRTVGIVDVDETRISKIQTKFRGWIEELYVDFVGMPVKKGQPLFSVYSQELVATQEELLLALNDLDTPMKGEFASTFNQFSVDLLRTAQRRLELWDVPRHEIERIKKQRRSFKNLTIRSPQAGVVLDKKAFEGMNVGPGMNVFTVADLSHVWVLADIYEHDIAFVHLDQEAELSVISLPGKTFTGTITFIDYVVHTGTRTLKVRFECDNKDFVLKPGMYAVAQLKLNKGKALALPEEAIIDTGKRKLVFVAKGKGHFEPREVQIGFKADAFYQVLKGLSEGDEVVTSAQFLFDSESRLQALSTGGAHTMHGM